MIQAKAILRDAERILLAKHQVSLDEATAPMLSDALGEAAMLAIGPEWTKTTRAFQKTRQAHYLSAEYLIGRMVYANFYNLGILDDVRALLSRKGVDMAVLEDIEDAALGNGGLGRLAACFLDSAASLDLPLTGYGLRYRYGLFKQVLEDGMQKEIPDDWTRFGDPWSVRREELAVVVPMATGDVRAVPYDMPVIGYHTDTIGTLRLWQTESLHEFDFALFNDYKYAEACADKNRAEDITKCLYPNDWNIEGKRLVVIDDSIVRGTTMVQLVKMLRNAGAKEIHIRINSPEVIWPCFYGIDTDVQSQLISANKTVDEICEYIGADSLAFLSVEGLLKVMPKGGYCDACFTGRYPVAIPESFGRDKFMEGFKPRNLDKPLHFDDDAVVEKYDDRSWEEEHGEA